MGSVTPLEHTAIGALAGLTEVTLMQPTVAIKNALQEGRSLPRSLPQLYRGVAINAGAMLPITATQFGMNRVFDGVYRNVFGTQPDSAGRIMVAMAAGSSSAVFGCSAEFVMIQQQRSGRPLLAEIKHIVSTNGPMTVYKGFNATIARESLYAAGYLGVMPLLQRNLGKVPGVQDVPGGPLVLSGIVSGLLATVTTQPADTIKTRMQAFYDVSEYPQYRTATSTLQHIIKTEGPSKLFAGLIPRGLRITCAVFILTGTRNTALEVLETRRNGSSVV